MSRCKDCSHREVCFFRVQAGGDLVYCPLFAITDNMVEVVRCKDCKYWQDNNGGYPHEQCAWRGDETPDYDDYCSYGKRSEG